MSNISLIFFKRYSSMPDIIQLLPDHLANQIAAGEVIQRPASAVKELLENAIDAGATLIQLIIKDAGKELIQVIDNGKGMSPLDARMSFERHATSKIRNIDDLFSIQTMGFRGEALASIAAVAKVELKTRPHDAELGSHIIIESSEIQSQDLIACPEGTNFSIKHLFYNVPARRHFLKSNTTELKHIIEEFTRIALAYPHIGFRFTHNNVEQFRLDEGNLKTRIVGLLGSGCSKYLIPVGEDTDIINISGYIGKPEAATKTRGNQFFFVNNRFVKSTYLNHAVTTAFEGLITKETFPFYVLNIEIDPQRVDVNVHPTKQEVKFEDERILYAYIQAAVKHALAKFNVSPSIDFSVDSNFNNLEQIIPKQANIDNNSGIFNAFNKSGQAHFIDKPKTGNDAANWKLQEEALFKPNGAKIRENFILPTIGNAVTTKRSDLFGEEGVFAIPETSNSNDRSFEGLTIDVDSNIDEVIALELDWEDTQEPNAQVLQWKEYIVSSLKSGVLLVHQKRALERIIYQQLKDNVQNQEKITTQQLLFPISVDVSPADAILLAEILPDLKCLGYDLEQSDNNLFLLNGVPSDLDSGNEMQIIQSVLEQLKQNDTVAKDIKRERMIVTLSKRMALSKKLQNEEAQRLIGELFACEQPQYTPDGEKVFMILSELHLKEIF